MPPAFTGLDITPTRLIAVALKKRGRRYSLETSATLPLPTGVIVDGEVRDVDALAAAIRQLWSQGKFSSKVVNIGVANQRCITRVIDLNKMKKSQLKHSLTFEIEDYLPIPLEDAIWDFHTIGAYKDENGVQRERHVVVTAYRESVERLRDAVEGAGLKLRRIDLSAFALMRIGLPAVADRLQGGAVAPAKGKKGTSPAAGAVVALCDVGTASTNIVVSRGGVCEFNRIIGFGTRDFVKALSEQFGWSEEDAKRVSLDAGVLPLGGTESPGDPYTDSRKVTQYVADQCAQEIRVSLDYYHHTNEGQPRVEHIVLSGDGAMMRGIEQRIATEVGLPVTVLDAAARLDAASVQGLGVNHADMAVALGLAMEDAA